VPPVPVPPPYALHPSPYALRFPEDRRTGIPDDRTADPRPALPVPRSALRAPPSPASRATEDRSALHVARLAIRNHQSAIRNGMPSLRRRNVQRPPKPCIKTAISEECFHPANGNKSACLVSLVSYVQFGELPSPPIHGLKARATSLHPSPYALRFPEDRITGIPDDRTAAPPTCAALSSLRAPPSPASRATEDRSALHVARLAIRNRQSAIRNGMPSLRRRNVQRPPKPCIKIAIFTESFRTANDEKCTSRGV